MVKCVAAAGGIEEVCVGRVVGLHDRSKPRDDTASRCCDDRCDAVQALLRKGPQSIPDALVQRRWTAGHDAKAPVWIVWMQCIN